MRLISAALATLERSDRDASPRFSNRDPPRPPDQPAHRPTNPAPRSTTTFRGASRSLISAVVDDDVPWSVALGFCSAAFCRGAWVRVSSFDRAIYPGRRVLPRSTLSRSSFYGGVYPGRRRARPSALRLGPHGLPALQTQRQVPPSPPFCRQAERSEGSRPQRGRPKGAPAAVSLGLRFCRGACFRKVPRHAPTTTDRAAPRSVVVRGRVPQASPSRGTILAVRRE